MCACVSCVWWAFFFLSVFFVRKERKEWSYMGREVEWIWDKPREGKPGKNISYKKIFFQLKTRTKASLTILNSSCCQDIPLSQREKPYGEQLSQPSNRYYAHTDGPMSTRALNQNGQTFMLSMLVLKERTPSL